MILIPPWFRHKRSKASSIQHAIPCRLTQEHDGIGFRAANNRRIGTLHTTHTLVELANRLKITIHQERNGTQYIHLFQCKYDYFGRPVAATLEEYLSRLAMLMLIFPGEHVSLPEFFTYVTIQPILDASKETDEGAQQ